MDQTINRKYSNLYFFIYLLAGYGVVFTKNIYLFCILFLAIIIKYSLTVKSGLSIIGEWRKRKEEFQTLELNSQRKAKNILLFTYLVIILSLFLIIGILVFRYNFWSYYLLK